MMTFEQACLPHRDELLRRARRMLNGDASAAQDLVQDAMVRAMLAWPDFVVPEGADEAASRRAWIHRILRNQFISSCRARVRHAEACAEWAEDIVAVTMAAPGECPDDSLARHQLPKAVIQAMNRLQPNYRDVIERTARGENDKEIGAAIGQNPINVRKRLHRARRELQDYLRTRMSAT